MTDYVPYTPDEYAPDAPGTALHFQRWFENWIAGFEGAPGAPRLRQASLNRLTAGDDVRAVVTGTAGNAGSGSLTVAARVGISQFGTFRAVLSFSGTSFSAGQNRVRRIRGGVTSTVMAATSTNPATVDLTCIPGDIFLFEATGSTSSGGGSATITASIRTNNADLWPGEGLWGAIQGNSAAP
jgi:hypothetical protein